MTGVPPAGSGHSPKGGAASASPAKPSVPNAARLPWQGGKCRVPMWMMGCPAGFCDEEAFGEQYPERILFMDRGYFYPNKPIPYCFGPCCPGHGGPRADQPRFFQDGLTNEGRVMWCCVGSDFENLQESPAGFSGNPLVARENYLKASAIEARMAETQGGSVHESAVTQADAPTPTVSQ